MKMRITASLIITITVLKRELSLVPFINSNDKNPTIITAGKLISPPLYSRRIDELCRQVQTQGG